MVLLRPVLGLRGSYVPSVMNVLQLVGWTAFELWIMGHAAALISKELLGFSGLALWILVFAAFSVLLALGGPLAVVRKWLERFGFWAMLLASLYLTYRLLGQIDVRSLLALQGEPGASYWLLVDLVIAMPVSWLPLVADYNRFARSPDDGFRGTLMGYLIANVWFYVLGVVFIMSIRVGEGAPETELIVAMLALTAGWVALILILLDETDNVFADIYSAAVSTQNVFPTNGQRGLIVTVGLVGAVLAATANMQDYVTFLLLIGSVFVPLFALLLADYYVVRRGKGYDTGALYLSGGRYWFTGGINWPAVAVWVVGVAAYHWLTRTTSIGASVPAFVLTFALYVVVSYVRRHLSGHTRAGVS